MSCLDATFTLTPRSPQYWSSFQNRADLSCYGAVFWFVDPYDFSSLYTTDRFFFDGVYASDPNLDYTKWTNRKRAPGLTCYVDLRDFGPQKQLALIFGFDVLFAGIDGRVLVYSDTCLLQDQTLIYGDNQFLLELESLDQPLNLYFIHAGGDWFFKGLSGYVV